MRFRSALTSCMLCSAVCIAYAGNVPTAPTGREPPLDRAVSALISQLVDAQASEYRAARRVHPMPGAAGVELVSFTIEGFGGGNNYTFYLAAFQAVGGLSAAARSQLLGVSQIGGGGWRFVDTDHIKASSQCVTLETMSYATADPMSHPTISGTATYCLRQYPGQATQTFEPVGDTTLPREPQR